MTIESTVLSTQVVNTDPSSSTATSVGLSTMVMVYVRDEFALKNVHSKYCDRETTSLELYETRFVRR